MRKISHKEFWTTVNSHPDKDKVERIYKAFNEAEDFNTVEECKRYLLDNVLPAQKDAGAINGCHCEEDIGAYYLKVVETMEELVDGNVEWFQSTELMSEDILKEHWRRVGNLSRSYARQQKCHPQKRGFICYCDEHNH